MPACRCGITTNPDLFLAILEKSPLEPFFDAIKRHLEDCVGQSTVTTVVIEKRNRVLNLTQEKEEKEAFLSPLFRYSRDYTKEKRHLESMNASSTFLRVIRSTFEKYKHELEIISKTSITMFEEQKEMDTYDNSIAVMISMCEMCKSEVSIIEKKLSHAEMNEKAIKEDDRHSICRLMDTLVKMLDELKTEIVRIQRIDENGFLSFTRNARLQRRHHRVEHFV